MLFSPPLEDFFLFFLHVVLSTLRGLLLIFLPLLFLLLSNLFLFFLGPFHVPIFWQHLLFHILLILHLVQSTLVLLLLVHHVPEHTCRLLPFLPSGAALNHLESLDLTVGHVFRQASLLLAFCSTARFLPLRF